MQQIAPLRLFALVERRHQTGSRLAATITPRTGLLARVVCPGAVPLDTGSDPARRVCRRTSAPPHRLTEGTN
jgi:hypothetical protein